MIEPLITLKRMGQVMSKDLAKKLKCSERTLSVELYPHVAAGTVMSCRKYDGRGKCLGVEYRLSGTIPASKRGPKPGPRIQKEI